LSAPEHDHEWVWDVENPPGYVCACGEGTGSCENCEEPTHSRFCSGLCESQADDDAEVDYEEASDLEEPMDLEDRLERLLNRREPPKEEETGR
jgi:hypothetical protein